MAARSGSLIDSSHLHARLLGSLSLSCACRESSAIRANYVTIACNRVCVNCARRARGTKKKDDDDEYAAITCLASRLIVSEINFFAECFSALSLLSDKRTRIGGVWSRCHSSLSLSVSLLLFFPGFCLDTDCSNSRSSSCM